MGISALKSRSNTQVLKKARKNTSFFFIFEPVFYKNGSILSQNIAEIYIFDFDPCVFDRDPLILGRKRLFLIEEILRSI